MKFTNYKNNILIYNIMDFTFTQQPQVDTRASININISDVPEFKQNLQKKKILLEYFNIDNHLPSFIPKKMTEEYYNEVVLHFTQKATSEGVAFTNLHSGYISNKTTAYYFILRDNLDGLYLQFIDWTPQKINVSNQGVTNSFEWTINPYYHSDFHHFLYILQSELTFAMSSVATSYPNGAVIKYDGANVYLYLDWASKQPDPNTTGMEMFLGNELSKLINFGQVKISEYEWKVILPVYASQHVFNINKTFFMITGNCDIENIIPYDKLLLICKNPIIQRQNYFKNDKRINNFIYTNTVLELDFEISNIQKEWLKFEYEVGDFKPYIYFIKNSNESDLDFEIFVSFKNIEYTEKYILTANEKMTAKIRIMDIDGKLE